MIKAYVDIDSLFDLRLAVVHRLNPAAATELSTNPQYFVRFNDELWKISRKVKQAEYLEAYAKRNVDDLQNAVLTEVLDELENICRVDAMQNMFRNEQENNILTLNTYPIKLTDEQQQELAAQLAWHSSFGEVKMISLDPAFILPELIKEQTHTVFYDLDAWVNIHFKAAQNVCTMLFRPCTFLIVVPFPPNKLKSRGRVQKRVSFLFLLMLGWINAFRKHLSSGVALVSGFSKGGFWVNT